MSENAQRVFIFIIAIVFLLTTVAIGLYAVFDSSGSSDSSDQLSQQEIEKLLAEQQEDIVALTCTTDPSLTYTPQPPMEGKPLPNFTTVETIPELSCIDIVVGEGEEVLPSATVTAHYTGAVAKTGIVFQSSLDTGNPIPFSLTGVIEGWTKGVPGMKVGGVRRISIPSAQAYGESGTAGIPPNSDLVFDVEIVKIGE